MNDEFDIESLADTWNEQKSQTSFDAKSFKRRLYLQKLAMLAISTLELMILAAVIWGLIMAFTHSWSLLIKLWLFFGLISGSLLMIPLIKSRLASVKMLDLATSEWLKYQLHLSQETLYRGRLSRYFILSFSVAFIVFLLSELLIEQPDYLYFALRFCFGLFWLLLAWTINQRQLKKHQLFIDENLNTRD